MTNEQTPLFAVVKWGDGTSDLAQLPPSGMYDDMVQDKYVRYSDYAALEQECKNFEWGRDEMMRNANDALAEVERLRAAVRALWGWMEENEPDAAGALEWFLRDEGYDFREGELRALTDKGE